MSIIFKKFKTFVEMKADLFFNVNPLIRFSYIGIDNVAARQIVTNYVYESEVINNLSKKEYKSQENSTINYRLELETITEE